MGHHRREKRRGEERREWRWLTSAPANLTSLASFGSGRPQSSSGVTAMGVPGRARGKHLSLSYNTPRNPRTRRENTALGQRQGGLGRAGVGVLDAPGLPRRDAALRRAQRVELRHDLFQLLDELGLLRLLDQLDAADRAWRQLRGLLRVRVPDREVLNEATHL
jgi:hypothetical protein